MDKFTLSIDLGNEAMQLPEDVAEALRKIADRLHGEDSEGIIRDANGNTVGSYQFTNE